jgi:hypothetical protein
VSVWFVGLAGSVVMEMPVLDPKAGHVTGWHSAWQPSRRGWLSINLYHFPKHAEAKFFFNVESGYQESEVL